MEHQLTHLPANRFCEACILSKMQQVRHFAGALDRSLIAFCQIVTLDLMPASADSISRGITCDIDALTADEMW